jgi:hypothetical protein
MFGRTKSNGEDIFEKEERLRDELDAARRQLQETTTKGAELDAQYRREASAALASGDPQAALLVREQLDTLNVRRDGLAQRIADLEPKSEEAGRLAQGERLKVAQAERREKFQQLVERGRAAAQRVVEKHEDFMRAISALDDAREELFAPGCQDLGGPH